MFRNRVRLPFFLSKPQFPVERNVFRKADGSSKLLSAVIRNTYEGRTDQLPEDWHRKLTIAIAHDDVTIEDKRFITDVVLDGEYEIDWQDFLNYPVAQAGFKIQTTPFNASNSNCQSCSEITQLNLVDDFTDEVWAEGTTHEYPDLITGNDSICCYPFQIEIVSFNTDYFDSVTVDQDGVLTAVVSALVPVISDVLIATYLVTCENGGYDEANVYGNITGTDTICTPPTGLAVAFGTYDGTVPTTASWSATVPPPAVGYIWKLYLAADLFPPVATGTTTGLTANLGGLEQGTDYILTLQSDCGGVKPSIVSQLNFTTPITDPDGCGFFTLTNIPNVSSGPQSATYMNCVGVVTTYYFLGAGSTNICALIYVGETEPVYFSASTPDITLNYVSLCGE